MTEETAAVETTSKRRRVIAAAAAAVVVAFGTGLVLTSDARADDSRSRAGQVQQGQEDRAPDHDCPNGRGADETSV
jgi:hypothetical protein